MTKAEEIEKAEKALDATVLRLANREATIVDIIKGAKDYQDAKEAYRIALTK